MNMTFHTLHRHAIFFGIVILYAISSGQNYSFDNIPNSNYDSLLPDEMILLSPQLRGNFTRNFIWPGLTNTKTPEVGIRMNGFDISSLSVWGEGNIANHSSGLLLTGFNGSTEENQDLEKDYHDSSVIEKRANSQFAIHGKTYFQSYFPDLFNGVSAECYYRSNSDSWQNPYWNSSQNLSLIHI
jgi:hypothetical protein